MTNDARFLREYREMYDSIEKIAKNKTVTERFAIIEPALKLCQEFANDNEGKVKVEYDFTDVEIEIRCPMFDVMLQEMPKFRELIGTVDTFEVIPSGDEAIISFNIKNVFKL